MTETFLRHINREELDTIANNINLAQGQYLQFWSYRAHAELDEVLKAIKDETVARGVKF